MSIELKDITSGNPTWGAGRSPSTSLVVADRQPMVTPPMRQMVVRSLLTPGTTSSNAIEYAVETDRSARHRGCGGFGKSAQATEQHHVRPQIRPGENHRSLHESQQTDPGSMRRSCGASSMGG